MGADTHIQTHTHTHTPTHTYRHPHRNNFCSWQIPGLTMSSFYFGGNLILNLSTKTIKPSQHNFALKTVQDNLYFYPHNSILYVSQLYCSGIKWSQYSLNEVKYKVIQSKYLVNIYKLVVLCTICIYSTAQFKLDICMCVLVE